MKIKIERIINKINEKEGFDFDNPEYFYFYNILYIFLKNYLITERLKELTFDEIYNQRYYTTHWYGGCHHKNEVDANKILNLLLERGILLKSNRKTFDGAIIDIYCLSYAYINNIENMIKYEVDKPKDFKIGNDIISDFEKYKTYSDYTLKNIKKILEQAFNFHVEIDNGMIDFQMGGCDYNVYLSRGYIVLEEADNSTIENAWTVEDINEFIDLIKDLKEDN